MKIAQLFNSLLHKSAPLTKPDFISANSIKDAENFLQDNYGIKTNYKGITLEGANRLTTQLVFLLNNYPVKITTFSIVELNYTTYAATDTENHTIALNTLYYKDLDKLNKDINNDMKKGWHPKTTDNKGPEFILTHEYGHIIRKDKILNTPFEKQYTKIWDLAAENPTHFANTLSIYGTKDSSECFSEAFGEALHNSHPRIIAQQVMEIVEEVFK